MKRLMYGEGDDIECASWKIGSNVAWMFCTKGQGLVMANFLVRNEAMRCYWGVGDLFGGSGLLSSICTWTY